MVIVAIVAVRANEKKSAKQTEREQNWKILQFDFIWAPTKEAIRGVAL